MVKGGGVSSHECTRGHVGGGSGPRGGVGAIHVSAEKVIPTSRFTNPPPGKGGKGGKGKGKGKGFGKGKGDGKGKGKGKGEGKGKGKGFGGKGKGGK